MLNAAQMSKGEKNYAGKGKKRFMDYAIWVDFPINTALLVFFIIKLKEVLRVGIDVALESDMGTLGSEKLDMLAVYGMPVLGFIGLFSFVIEAIYLAIKSRGKQPYITERYAIATIMGKIIFIIMGIMAFLLI